MNSPVLHFVYVAILWIAVIIQLLFFLWILFYKYRKRQRVRQPTPNKGFRPFLKITDWNLN
jgi:hypothetical protein